MFVTIAYAADGVPGLLSKINQVLINPLIILLFAAALCLFLYGVFEFFRNYDNATAQKEGKNHMIWGIIGLFIMMSAYAIINVVMDTLGNPSDSRKAIEQIKK